MRPSMKKERRDYDAEDRASRRRSTMIGQRTIGLVLVLGLVMLMGSSGVTAQERRADGETLGKVRFPVSCSAAAQPQFERAVALLHSFWYEEAVKAFTSVTTTDPAYA